MINLFYRQHEHQHNCVKKIVWQKAFNSRNFKLRIIFIVIFLVSWNLLEEIEGCFLLEMDVKSLTMYVNFF